MFYVVVVVFLVAMFEVSGPKRPDAIDYNCWYSVIIFVFVIVVVEWLVVVGKVMV